MIIFNHISHYWQNLSKTNQKLLKLLIIFSGILLSFYYGKNLIIKHFIGEFLKKPPVVAIGQTQSTPWVENYQTIGQIKAIKAINLSAQAPGLIRKINFHPGQKVKHHRLLVQLDDRLEKAQFSLELADYKLQQKLFEQQEQLWKTKTIAQSQYIQAKANLEKAKASLKAAKAQLHEKQIRAPFSGIVGIPEVHLGEYITPGQQHIASLQQINHLYIDFYLPEKYYSQLKIGNLIHFKTQESDKFVKKAKIYAIEPASQQMAHTIWIRAKINNRKQQFIPGLFAHIQIPVKTYRNVLSIPTSALLGSSKGAMVYVASEKIHPDTKKSAWFVEQRLVKTGPAKNNQTLIVAGLEPKEWIITSGTQKVQPSSWVSVKGS
jgi:membrane fusion protein (multidrug efflux system)